MSYRTRLFLDKISITVHVDRSLHHRILLASEGMELQEKIRRKSGPSELLKNYRRAYTLGLGGGEELTIQLDPRREARNQQTTAFPHHRFLRLEWNPCKAHFANHAAFTLITQFLAELIPGFEIIAFLEAINITRIDISFDVRGVHVDGLCISALLRRTFTGHYVYGPSGARNSMEFGQPTSDQYLLVYDKNLEQKINKNGRFDGSPINDARRAKVVRRSRTRFELRLRDVGPLSRLFSMPNPFSRYTVRGLFNVERERRGHVFEWFLDSCRQRGVQAALSRIENPRQRTKYALAIREAQPPSWWEPSVLWNELAAAVKEAFSAGG
jgi:hypothetical protein